jgi:hypothetical protein
MSGTAVDVVEPKYRLPWRGPRPVLNTVVWLLGISCWVAWSFFEDKLRNVQALALLLLGAVLLFVSTLILGPFRNRQVVLLTYCVWAGFTVFRMWEVGVR